MQFVKVNWRIKLDQTIEGEQKELEFLLMTSRLTERQDGSGLINCYCFAELTSSPGHKKIVSLSQTHLHLKDYEAADVLHLVG